jgi:hypothetical protein
MIARFGPTNQSYSNFGKLTLFRDKCAAPQPAALYLAETVDSVCARCPNLAGSAADRTPLDKVPPVSAHDRARNLSIRQIGSAS